MCDIQVIDAGAFWNKPDDCDRKGKYTVDVQVSDRYDPMNGQTVPIAVCGQHKNMLERGRRMDATILGKRRVVEGRMSELGQAEKDVKYAEAEYDSMRRALNHKRASIGEAADFAFDRLLEATEDNEHLRDFVSVLLTYKETKDKVAEYRRKLTIEEAKVERLKGLTKDS